MKKWNPDDALKEFKRLRQKQYFEECDDHTESDTRSKIIDAILLQVLGWCQEDIKREERCVDSNTFLDYKLITNTPQIIIEAKKSSISFDFPSSSNNREYKIGGVLKNCKVLQAAIKQARDYAIAKGIMFGVVTNGREYAFFRVQNIEGIEWTEHLVMIFRNLDDIESNFDLFCKLLSKTSVENGNLPNTLKLSSKSNDQVNKYKTLDTRHLTRPRKKDRNTLFPYIGEIVQRVFQDLATEEAESEILEHCYVDSPKKSDKNTPYMDIETKKLHVSKKNAGEFQQRITTTLTQEKLKSTEVILLIGSVGVGKSTFIQRFRKVLAKKEIDEKGIWIYLNFKHYSDTGDSIDGFIFQEIEKILSSEYSHLDLQDWSFLKQIYHSEYEKLKRGQLSPLYNKNPEEFEITFGEKVDDWISNKPSEHYERLLTTASSRFNKKIFLVFDNADQLDTTTQNKIFLAAQKLAETIKCCALIAMREESYWKNRDSGPLNAFHTNAYHVQPATLKQVISKRFAYAKGLIASHSLSIQSQLDITESELLGVFDRLVQTLLGSDERYINFIEATASRDMRRALDNIAAFMISGHTNINAILSDVRRTHPVGFPIPFHEFLNSIILRDHEVYTEDLCDVMNLFNVTGTSDASNFNRITVLGRILNSQNVKAEIGTGYVKIEEVINDCYSVGILPETTISILSTLNSRRLIETETTIKDDITTSYYVRATMAANYYVDTLSKLFGYLDLIVYQTPVCNEKSFKKLNKINGEINAVVANKPQDRLHRLKKRLELTEVFIEYLYSEFQKCTFRTKQDLFSSESRVLMSNIKTSFSKEKEYILQRATELFGK